MSEKKNENSIVIKTKINKNDMFEFTMNNNYKSIVGVISLMFSFACIVGAVFYWNKFDSNFYRVLIIIFSMMFTVFMPIECYIRAARQVKKVFKDELIYEMNEQGLKISIKDQSSFMKWEDTFKVISTKHLVAVYSSVINAFIIPKRDIGDNFEELKEIMEKNTKCYKFVMK